MRNCIVLKNVCGKANNVLTTITVDWLHLVLPLILEEYGSKSVFNADETSLFYCCLFNKTLSLKGKSCSGGKIWKERITVLVGCNAEEFEKLPLFVI